MERLLPDQLKQLWQSVQRNRLSIEDFYVVENGMLALAGTGRELMENPEVQSAYFGI